MTSGWAWRWVCGWPKGDREATQARDRELPRTPYLLRRFDLNALVDKVALALSFQLLNSPGNARNDKKRTTTIKRDGAGSAF